MAKIDGRTLDHKTLEDLRKLTIQTGPGRGGGVTTGGLSSPETAGQTTGRNDFLSG